MVKRNIRPNYITIFLKKWIKFLLLAVLIFALGGLIVIFDMKGRYKDEFRQDILYIQDGIENDIAKGFGYPTFNQSILTLRTHANGLGITCMLYETNTGKSLLTCEESLIFVQKGSKGVAPFIYSCPLSEVEDWEKIAPEIAQQSLKEDITLAISMSEAYIKDHKCIPGAMTITVLSQNEIEHSSGSDEDYIDEATKALATLYLDGPKNIPDGYEKITLDETYSPVLICGYSHGSVFPSFSGCEDAYTQLMLEFDKVKKGGHSSHYHDMVAKEEGLTTTFFSCTDYTLSSGEEVSLIAAFHFDPIGIIGLKNIIQACIALLVSMTVFTLVVSYYAYLKAKSKFDMVEYRQMLMSTMAHDLKSPLMSISGYAENLRDNVHTEKREHYANSILENVSYMDGLIASVLDTFKAESADLKLKRTPTDMKALLEEVFKQYESLLDAQELRTQIEGNITLTVDPVLFRQAIANLVENAVKYATKGSVLSVKMTKLLDKKSITLSNPCSGDLSKVIKTLDQPFVQADESRGNKKGHGLGLAIVKNICLAHGYKFHLNYKDGKFEAAIKIH